MNPFELMKNLQGLQQNMADMQAKMAAVRVEGRAGGDLVRVVLDGGFGVVDIRVAPELLDPAQAQVVQDLLKSAYADAHAKLKDIMAREMGAMAGGLPFMNQFMGKP